MIIIIFLAHFKISQDKFTELLLSTNSMEIVKEFQKVYPNWALSFSVSYFEDSEIRYSYSLNNVKSELVVLHTDPIQITLNCYHIQEHFEQILTLTKQNPTIQDIQNIKCQ